MDFSRSGLTFAGILTFMVKKVINVGVSKDGKAAHTRIVDAKDSPVAIRKELLSNIKSLSHVRSAVERSIPDDEWKPIEGKSVSTGTPWGKADYGYKYASGINNYSCPGHGGFKVANGKLAKMPEPLRRIGEDGWFEEDVEWAAVAVSFPEAFKRSHVEQAVTSLKDYYPHEWMEATGEVLTTEDSYTLLKEEFQAENFDNWVGRSAVYAQDADGNRIEGMTKVWLRQPSTGEEREVLVPSEDYETRNQFGYVVEDPDDFDPAS